MVEPRVSQLQQLKMGGVQLPELWELESTHLKGTEVENQWYSQCALNAHSEKRVTIQIVNWLNFKGKEADPLILHSC